MSAEKSDETTPEGEFLDRQDQIRKLLIELIDPLAAKVQALEIHVASLGGVRTLEDQLAGLRGALGGVPAPIPQPIQPSNRETTVVEGGRALTDGTGTPVSYRIPLPNNLGNIAIRIVDAVPVGVIYIAANGELTKFVIENQKEQS